MEGVLCRYIAGLDGGSVIRSESLVLCKDSCGGVKVGGVGRLEDSETSGVCGNGVGE